jgi:hypothetical protein
MTQVVVARFLDLPQAQVAASALRSAGLRPILFDEHQCFVNWPYMFAIGGCRLAVPTNELQDAVAILGHPHPDANPEPAIAPMGWPWRFAAAALGLGLLIPLAGWLVLGVRSKRRGLTEVLMGAVLAAIVTGGLIALCLGAETLASGLLTPSILPNAFYGP